MFLAILIFKCLKSVTTLLFFCNLSTYQHNWTRSKLKNLLLIFLGSKLKHDSHEFIMPSNSNIFFMPNTRSAFSCISDTNVKIMNLWPYISTTIGTVNNTLTNCPFPTGIHCISEANFGN